MTSSKGSSEFCFPETLIIEQTAKNYLFSDVGWQTNLRRFQGIRSDHARVESSNCYFPRELVSFVRPRELVSFVRPRELVSFVRPRELVSFDS